MEFHTLLEAFEQEHPKPNRDEWIKFAARTYMAARKFGFEEGLQTADARDGLLTPERIADLEDPSWRESPAVDLTDVGARALDSIIAGDTRNEAS